MCSLLWSSSTWSSLCSGRLANVALPGCSFGHSSSSSLGQYNASGEYGSSMTSRTSRCGQTSMSNWCEARLTIYLATLVLGAIMLVAEPFTYLCNQPGHLCIGCGVKNRYRLAATWKYPSGNQVKPSRVDTCRMYNRRCDRYRSYHRPCRKTQREINHSRHDKRNPRTNVHFSLFLTKSCRLCAGFCFGSDMTAGRGGMTT